LVDALDSKREDLGADLAIICSNSGFTKDALAKAKRKKIGMISILKFGDNRVKSEIHEQIYFRKVWFLDMNVQLRFKNPSEHCNQNLRELQKDIKIHELRYQGLSVDNWLQHKIAMFVTVNPMVVQKVTGSFDFKIPTILELKGTPVVVEGITISFRPEVKWYSQTVINRLKIV